MAPRDKGRSIIRQLVAHAKIYPIIFYSFCVDD